jgi:hypothetical protein
MLVLAFLAVWTPVQASPIQWTTGTGANFHWYDVVTATTLDWSGANSAANSSSMLPYTGDPVHLVTITSAEENLFVSALLNSRAPGEKAWIGLYQPQGSAEPAGGWTWVTGEAFVFNNWAIGEPNNYTLYFGGEDSGQMLGFSNASGRLWNDVNNNVPGFSGYRPTAYIIEAIGTPPNNVPDGGMTLALLGGALVGLGAARRKLRG